MLTLHHHQQPPPQHEAEKIKFLTPSVLPNGESLSIWNNIYENTVVPRKSFYQIVDSGVKRWVQAVGASAIDRATQPPSRREQGTSTQTPRSTRPAAVYKLFLYPDGGAYRKRAPVLRSSLG